VSVFVTRRARCPRCGHEEQRSVAESVNGGRSPEYRDAILAGRFHVFPCGGCGVESRADEPFLYTDFARKEWIRVLPAREEPQWARHEPEARTTFLRAFRLDVASGPGARRAATAPDRREPPPVLRAMAEGFRSRLVFGLAALREKLLVFGAGLDDALIEGLKLDLMRGHRELSFEPSRRPRLHAVGEETLRFYVRESGPGADLREAELLEIELPRSAYDRLAARAEAYRTLLDALREGDYVDLGRLFWPAPS